ncbi:MAG: YggS family pyridoxal phosphate-dependent enzyme [Actinomycetota bacterium]|nr:YggS family pyridoxal phosphate-dependent enzyme [Actinomycetota bacterium]
MRYEMRVEEISSRLEKVRAQLPDSVTLIVVTKNFPVSDIEILYDLGERNFGENRVQELVEKRDFLESKFSEKVKWHYQGQIQSNKIKLLNQYADVIHSLSTPKIIEDPEQSFSSGGLNFQNLDKWDPSREVFLQVNLDPFGSTTQLNSEPVTGGRAGVSFDDAIGFSATLFNHFGSNFKGVMAIAPHFEGIGEEAISAAFGALQKLSQQIRATIPSASSISAGMSDDYQLALRYGATQIRLGSSILGKRALPQ